MNSFVYAVSMIRETYYSEYADKGEECRRFYQNVISILHSAYLCEHIQYENQKYRDFQQKHEQTDNESVLDALRCRYATLIKESEK